MGLIGINAVSGDRPRKPSTMEQIALGVDMASKILGAGLQGYKTFGPEADEAKARTELYKAQAISYPEKAELERKNLIADTKYKEAMVPLEMITKRAGATKSVIEAGKMQEEQAHGKPIRDNKDAVEFLNELDAQQSRLEDIEKRFKELPEAPVGPTNQIKPEFLKQWFESEEGTQLRQELSRYNDIYRKQITGAGAGLKELARLEKSNPNENDLSSKFLPKVIASIQGIKKAKTEFIQNMKRAGWDMRAYESDVKPSSDGGKILVHNPKTGESLRIDKSDLEDAKKDGFQIK